MARRKAKRPKRVSRRRKTKGKGKPSASVSYILEQGTLQELRAAKRRMAAFLRFHWNFYSDLAYQRSLVEEELLQALNESCTSDFKFKQWQRAVKYKYSLDPLSTRGSTGGIGGRFNAGADIGPNFQSFSTLYLAIDKDTALQETLGLVEPDDSELSALERALINPKSVTIVSISGRLEQILDIRTVASLRRFSSLIKNFTLSTNVINQARSLGQTPPRIVKKPSELRESLIEKEWQVQPMQYDVPSNSQIFGYLIYTAGIDGILYPSKWTGKDCLAIFPRNFAHTSSYVELDDPCPAGVPVKRLDESNCDT